MRLTLPDRHTLIDSARVALQSAIAAVAVVYLMRLFGLPHLSWAVISALYVTQHSLDSTFGVVRSRMLGTLLGAAVGLSAVWLFQGDAGIAMRLGLSALVINALASAAPGLRYGVVAAAIITLEPGAEPWEGAIDRVIAIAVGSAAGALCAALIWPQSAYVRGLREARLALGDTADLLDMSIGRIDDRLMDVRPLHDRFLRHIQRARAQLLEARTRRTAVAQLQRMVHALERLWHALILFDRITGEDRADDAEQGDQELARCLHAVRRHACEYLTDLAGVLGRQAPPTPPGVLHEVLRQARDLASSRNVPSAGIDTTGLAFALKELDKHVGEIADAAWHIRY